MRTLIFHCPRTGRDIISGIQLDDSSLRCVAELPVTLRCSCGDVHRMRVKDGQVGMDTPPGSPPLAPSMDERLATPLKRIFPGAKRDAATNSGPMAIAIAFPTDRVKGRGRTDNAR